MTPDEDPSTKEDDEPLEMQTTEDASRDTEAGSNGGSSAEGDEGQTSAQTADGHDGVGAGDGPISLPFDPSTSADDGAETYEMQDGINRIIIGLGGQGGRIINEVREHLMETGGIPDSVEFIAIDSDRTALEGLDQIPSEQKVHFHSPDDKITETVVPWLPREYRPKAGGGCGMQRITGKAIYHVHRERVFETVNATIRRLKRATQMDNYMFMIIGALGGGTGSGMLIDFSIDLRNKVLDLVGTEPLLFGLGVLPSQSETIQRANGVAAVKELHFLLSKKEPVRVSGRDISNPFELFFLVGRESLGAEQDEDLTESIIRFVTDLGLIPNKIQEKREAAKGTGWLDLQDIRTLTKGSSHMFATFGYYKSEFPMETLDDLFEAEDALQEARQAVPSLDTDEKLAEQKIQDLEVNLEERETQIEAAEERARVLQDGGFFNLNRSRLVSLYEAINNAKAELRKDRAQLEELKQRVPEYSQAREAAAQSVERLEEKRNQLLDELLSPQASRNTYRFGLDKEEISELRDRRTNLPAMGMHRTMQELDREREYFDKTMEVVGKNKILFMPVLNYRLAFHTAEMFRPEVLRAMSEYGFVTYDDGGNPVIKDDQLWMVLTMVTSHPDNIDPDRLGARSFKDVVENYVAKRAEVKNVGSKLRKWEVSIYSWMIGLQISPVAPGYPPRLKELEWLGEEYEKVAGTDELIQHHTFLYGDPAAFRERTGLPIDPMDPQEATRRITEFWQEYEPLDHNAKWGQAPPLMGEAIALTQDLRTTLSRAQGDLEVDAGLDDELTEEDMASVARRVEKVGSGLTTLRNELTTYTQRSSGAKGSIQARIRTVLSQLQSAQRSPGRDRLHRLIEMAEGALHELRDLQNLVEDVETLVGEDLDTFRQQIAQILDRSEANDRFKAKLRTRTKRGLRDLEDEIRQSREAFTGVTGILHDLQEMISALANEFRNRQSGDSTTPTGGTYQTGRPDQAGSTGTLDEIFQEDQP